jgi:MFS family permease
MTYARHRRRNALFLFFFVVGVSMASWITRTPAIRDSLQASIADMGMVLFGLSLGSMAGILAAGWMVARHGTRTVTGLGMLGVVAGLATMAAGVATGQAPWVGAGLGLVGAGMGLSEIAINIDGAHVESLLGRPVLHALHGFFSLGASCGALLGMGLATLAVPVHWHLGAVALLALALAAPTLGHLPAGHGRTGEDGSPAIQAPGRMAPGPLWRDRRLWALGFIVMAMAFAEGSASDWLALLMVDEHGFGEAMGSASFVVFALAMTAGRFGGGWLLARYGRATVLRASALLGATGLATMVFAEHQALAALAVLLWGLGAALGFPVALSAAGDSGPDAPARVRWAATAGYMAFLVGPPLLGFIGDAVGLRHAMLLVLALVALAGLAAGAARPPATPVAAGPVNPARCNGPA